MLNRMLYATAAIIAMLLTLTGKAADAPKVSPNPGPQGVEGSAMDNAAKSRELLLQGGEYWLGVYVTRPTPELQAKLNLPQEQCLLVESVEPTSPAARAGIKSGDVLLKANDKPLGDPRGFMNLINEVKEDKLTLDVLRDGKHETIVAKPAKRPAVAIQPLGPEARAWIERLGAPSAFPSDGQPLRFHIVGPGQIVPSTAAVPGAAATSIEMTICTKATLADGSRIEITRESGKPATVVVTHDKDRWEGTAEDLTKIPEKARPEVERLMHMPMEHLRILESPAGPVSGNVFYFGGPATLPKATAVGSDVEKRFLDMQKQIDELRQQVKELQGNARAK